MARTLSLYDLESHRRFHASGHWRPETYYQRARSLAQQFPDRAAVRDRFRRLTYRELVQRADAVAAHLAAAGVRAGERVVLWLPTRAESVIALLACSRNGYVVVPSPHVSHSVAEVIELLQRVRARAFFYEHGYGADARAVDVSAELSKCRTLRDCVRLQPLHEGWEPPFLARRRTGDETPVCNNADRVSYLSFTSGSTGQPKGVMHSDNTLVSVLRSMTADWGMGPETVVYSLSPFSHGLGVHGWLAALVSGGTYVIHDLPRGASLIERMAEVGATYVVGVPTHAIDFLTELRERRDGVPRSIRCFRSSGAAAARSVLQELLARGVPMQSGYGMTENCAHNYTRPGDEPRRVTETVGRTCSGYEVSIFAMDDADQPAKPGEVGQIGGRGASLMLGYFGDQAATDECFNADGWFMSGDLGWLDADGYLHVVGRKKDLIIRGGHNINPQKIEDMVMAHEAVARAAVLPYPDERLGERICLALSFKPGAAAVADDVLMHLRTRGLSKYEMPEYVIALPEIPVMSNGKIRKQELIKALEMGAIVPQRVILPSS